MELLRLSRGFRFEHLPPAADIALEVFVHNNNIFAAESAADLFHAAAKGTAWEKCWRRCWIFCANGKLI